MTSMGQRKEVKPMQAKWPMAIEAEEFIYNGAIELEKLHL
jgi:hypothetical protein